MQGRREFLTGLSTVAVSALIPRRRAATLDLRSIMQVLGVAEHSLRIDASDVAAQVLDVARDAGATFADVRVDHERSQSLSAGSGVGGGGMGYGIGYGESVGYGVRVIADGQWGFAASNDFGKDAIADATKRAVHQARVNAGGRKTPVDLAPAPIVPKGRWNTPAQNDPFDVPAGEQYETLAAGALAALGVQGVKSAYAGLSCVRLERTFASMEGSHIEQVFLFLFPEARVHTGGSTETLEIGGTVEGIGWCAGGYEVFKRVNLAAAMRRAAESIEHVRLHQLDVGRYELVADAAVMAGLVSGTLLPATDLDRALGSRSDGVGTSFAAPPTDVLGRLAMATPQLTVRANRTLVGGLMTVGWDDEGVPPDDVVLINHGILVDYQTMRANASQLAGWYRGRGATVRSHGGAVAFVMGMPINGLPNFTVAPASHAATVKDLIGDVKRGIYLSGAGGAAGDFQLLSAYGGASMAQEIRNGRLVGYLSDVAINFRTREFWQGLLTVGGDNAVSTVTLGEQGPFTCCTVQSPPASFLGVNVNRTDRLL